MGLMQTYIFKTSLLRSKGISRDIEILGRDSLYDLAEAIIGAYGFDFDHCFGFFSKVTIGESRFDSEEKYELFTDLIEAGQDIEPTGAASVKKTKVSAVWHAVGDAMLFMFDYGDDWRFSVKLIGHGSPRAKVKYPRVVNKIGKAPKQYS